MLERSLDVLDGLDELGPSRDVDVGRDDRKPIVLDDVGTECSTLGFAVTARTGEGSHHRISALRRLHRYRSG